MRADIFEMSCRHLRLHPDGQRPTHYRRSRPSYP